MSDNVSNVCDGETSRHSARVPSEESLSALRNVASMASVPMTPVWLITRMRLSTDSDMYTTPFASTATCLGCVSIANDAAPPATATGSRYEADLDEVAAPQHPHHPASPASSLDSQRPVLHAPSPEEPRPLPPAMVVMTPLIETLRTALFPESAIIRLPCASTATSLGSRSVAEMARRPAYRTTATIVSRNRLQVCPARCALPYRRQCTQQSSARQQSS